MSAEAGLAQAPDSTDAGLLAAPRAAAPMARGAPSRDAVATFFTNAMTKMQAKETREMLKDPKVKVGEKMVELQRAEWDPLGIDRDIGCQTLDTLQEKFPGDNTILEMKREFIICAERTYIRSIEDRKPEELEKKKGLPREVIIEFFNACNTQMDLPETHARLSKHLRETKQVPNQVLIAMQREMLENLGWQADHGVAMLNQIGKDFPEDRQLHMFFEGWRQKARETCLEVVQAYEAAGGKLPAGTFKDAPVNPEMQKMQEKAKEEISAMSPKERGEFIEKMSKKCQVMMNLPPDARFSYMQKLSEPEKLEMIKAQILMVSLMQQRHGHHHLHHGQPADASSGGVATTPSQQTMM